MKRRLATLLAMALSITLFLGGCGDSSGKEITPKSIVDSKDSVIVYVTEKYDKDAKPKKVIVFEDGVATLYDTGDYTMGDFAQMTDEEVEENLLAIIEEKNNAEIEKNQEYLTGAQNQVEDLKTASDFFQNNETCGEWLEAVLYVGIEEILYSKEYTMDDEENVYVWIDVFHQYLEENLTDVDRDICEALYYNLARKNEDELFGQGTSLAEDWQNYMARHEGEKFAPIFNGYINTDEYGLEDIKAATELFDTVIAEGIESGNEAVNSLHQESIDNLQQQIDSYNETIEELQSKEIAGESYPAVVDLITDGTGNNV